MASALDRASGWQKRWGHGEAGMESEEGTAFESLPRREPCRNRAPLSMLYGVTPNDPASIVAAIFTMVAVSLLASAIPARRVTKVDPTVALRCE